MEVTILGRDQQAMLGDVKAAIARTGPGWDAVVAASRSGDMWARWLMGETPGLTLAQALPGNTFVQIVLNQAAEEELNWQDRANLARRARLLDWPSLAGPTISIRSPGPNRRLAQLGYCYAWCVGTEAIQLMLQAPTSASIAEKPNFQWLSGDTAQASASGLWAAIEAGLVQIPPASLVSFVVNWHRIFDAYLREGINTRLTAERVALELGLHPSLLDTPDLQVLAGAMCTWAGEELALRGVRLENPQQNSNAMDGWCRGALMRRAMEMTRGEKPETDPVHIAWAISADCHPVDRAAIRLFFTDVTVHWPTCASRRTEKAHKLIPEDKVDFSQIVAHLYRES